jgi:hypothetical protein
MWMRGKGFAMYPGREVSEYYSPKVVRYLWTLAPIAGAPGASNALKGAVADALAMADDVSRPFKIAKTPDRIGSPEDAWQIAARVPSRRKQVTDWIASAVDSSGKEPKARADGGAVESRATLAFAGAALVACGELAGALKMANVVLRDMNEQGRLYSTVDSVAAIALFGELAAAGVLRGNGRVRMNGRELTAIDAAASSDQVETVDVLDGVIAVEITRIHEEDWTRFSSDLPVRVGFRDQSGKTPSKFDAGDRLDLRVELPKGYQDGDLVHVALPASLAWIEGGGSVKRFSRDFEGRNELVVPLVVTGAVDGKQHFAVCVRNMFEEERAVSPGLLSIGGM